MTLLMVLLLAATSRLPGMAGLLGSSLSVLLPPAAVGAYLLRRGACFREVTVTALLAALLLTATLWVIPVVPGRGFSFGDYPGVWRDQLQQALVYIIVATAGVFALPLVDQEVRRQGVAPPLRRLLITGLVTTAIMVFIEYSSVRQWGGLGYAQFGLGTLTMGAIAGLALVGIGTVLTVVGRTEYGANLGGAGIVLAAYAIVVWVVTGMRWFP